MLDEKKVKALAKGHTGMTHGHGQLYRDCLRDWGGVEVGKARKNKDNCNSINNKIQEKKKVFFPD